MSIVNAMFVVGMVFYASNQPGPVITTPIVSTPTPTIIPSKPVTTTKPQVKQPVGNTTIVPTNSATTAPKIVPTVAPTTTPTIAPTQKPSGCVIQIDGVKYEITALTRSHSGGNVFTCGTDMSAIFWGRHNARILQMMAQYKI